MNRHPIAEIIGYLISAIGWIAIAFAVVGGFGGSPFETAAEAQLRAFAATSAGIGGLMMVAFGLILVVLVTIAVAVQQKSEEKLQPTNIVATKTSPEASTVPEMKMEFGPVLQHRGTWINRRIDGQFEAVRMLFPTLEAAKAEIDRRHS